MPHPANPLRVAGIDVGGARKGFHAVALEDGRYLDRFTSCDAAAVANWCRHTIDAQAIGVDAPCQWRTEHGARLAERQLLQAGISCFSTPTRERALQSSFFAWMLCGETIYQALRSTHLLATTLPAPAGTRVCFETFPHAIATALAGQPLRARNKLPDRAHLLAQAGVDITQLTSIDFIDAALCAYTAHHVALGSACQMYGDAVTGWIVVPPRGHERAFISEAL